MSRAFRRYHVKVTFWIHSHSPTYYHYLPTTAYPLLTTSRYHVNVTFWRGHATVQTRDSPASGFWLTLLFSYKTCIRVDVHLLDSFALIPIISTVQTRSSSSWSKLKHLSFSSLNYMVSRQKSHNQMKFPSVILINRKIQ